LPDGGVPSFLGLSARQAVQAFVQHHLAGELMLTGTGAVVHQDPAPGVSLAQQHNLQLMLAGP
jgi:hypothetical protein